MISIQKYNRRYNDCLFRFTERCLPESGRMVMRKCILIYYHQVKRLFLYMKKWVLQGLKGTTTISIVHQ